MLLWFENTMAGNEWICRKCGCSFSSISSLHSHRQTPCSESKPLLDSTKPLLDSTKPLLDSTKPLLDSKHEPLPHKDPLAVEDSIDIKEFKVAVESLGVEDQPSELCEVCLLTTENIAAHSRYTGHPCQNSRLVNNRREYEFLHSPFNPLHI